jgi:DNA-binding CsgD family transcriptional regulator
LETGGAKKKMAGFGFSLFVTREFADEELKNPRPGMNSRIVGSVLSDRPVMRSEAGLCETDEPLDVVIMGGHVRYEALSAEERIQAEMLMPAAFAEAHLGYNLNRALIETLTERHRELIESSGVWRKVVDYPNPRRALLMLTRKDAFSVSGSVAGRLFDYHKPGLGLRQTEKQLLAEALNGGTDRELAARLNLSLPTVKKRWAAVFDRIAEARPDLLPEGAPRESQESRGPQKRHRILAYVRSHPEEVRPYRWRMSGV